MRLNVSALFNRHLFECKQSAERKEEAVRLCDGKRFTSLPGYDIGKLDMEKMGQVISPITLAKVVSLRP